MSQLLEDLKAVRELLSVPKRWTKGNFAKDSKGRHVCFSKPEAYCFCILGAVGKVLPRKRHNRTIQTITGCLPTGIKFLAEWQDAPERTHAEVLDLLDRCIAKAEVSA